MSEEGMKIINKFLSKVKFVVLIMSNSHKNFSPTCEIVLKNKIKIYLKKLHLELKSWAKE